MGKMSLAEILDDMGYVKRSEAETVRIKAAKEAAKEATIELAREMLNEGDPIEKIARITKLSVNELEKLLHVG